jgi:hypothetical protein
MAERELQGYRQQNMSHENNHESSAGHGGFERRDIRPSGVLYFLAGLAVAGLIVHFLVTGVYAYLEKRTEVRQAPVSPLVADAPADTRRLTVDYRDYLKQKFPTPRLEIDERNQLDGIRMEEAQTLASYDWIDQKSGAVHIPIERAMDLIAQRGLPIRSQGTAAETPVTGSADQKTKSKKAKTK